MLTLENCFCISDLAYVFLGGRYGNLFLDVSLKLSITFEVQSVPLVRTKTQ